VRTSRGRAPTLAAPPSGVTVLGVGDAGVARLGMLGPFELEIDGAPVALGGLRQRALIAVLALNRNKVVTTDQLIDRLWGENPPTTAIHTVHQFVSRLRQALGPVSDRLATVPPGYCLALADGETDAAECEALYREAHRANEANRPAEAVAKLDDALKLWRGPPLADFTYESFAQEAIAQLDALRANCQEERVEAQLALGQHAKVAQDLGALIAEHPLREGLRRQLMLALYRSGRQAEALEVYQRARHTFIDYGIEPSPELRDLERAILQQDPSLSLPATASEPDSEPRSGDSGRPGALAGAGRERADPGKAQATVPPRAAVGAFVGRLEWRKRLRSRWYESRDGRTNVIWLAGEAGIGKTRLAIQFADEVRREGGVSLYGRADVDSLLPYQPLAEVLEDLMTQVGPRLGDALERDVETLSRQFPNLGRDTRAPATADDPEAMRYQVIDAVVSVLWRSSAQTPLLIVLDDLQWADQPTLRFLLHVLRRAEGARLLVLATFRPDVPSQPLANLLADLRRERPYDRLNLDGLDEEGTRKLVVDRAGIEVTSEFVQRLQAETDGNPFFIEETLRALAEHLRDNNGPGVVDQGVLEDMAVPEGVAELIMRRARELSPEARELLRVGSVVGPSFNIRFVEDVLRRDRAQSARQSDRPPIDVITAADEVLTAGLAREVSDQFEVLTCTHALVRRALYESLTRDERIRKHHQVASVLEQRQADADANPAELAQHFLEAVPVAGAERARHYSIMAGRRAAELLAYEEAAEHFRRALDLFDKTDEEERCDVLLELGRVQWHMGDENARSTFLEARDIAERRNSADQLARAAIGLGERYFEVTYLGELYGDLLWDALKALPREDSPRRVIVLARLATNLAFPIESKLGQELAAGAVVRARRLGNRGTLLAALIARHITLLDARHLEERLELSSEAASLAEAHEELATEAHYWRMYDLLGVGKLEAAEQECQLLEDLAERLGQPVLLSLAAGARGLWEEIAGHEEQAERCANDSLRYARLAHTYDAESSWGAQMFALRRRQGRLDELSDRVVEIVRQGGTPLGWRSALGVLRLETNDASAARAIYEQEIGKGPARLPRGMFWLTRIALLGELCSGLGDADGAARLYAELLPYSGHNVVVAYCSFWGPVDGYLARLAATFGDKSLAKQMADAAIEQALKIGAPVIAGELQRRWSDVEVAG
jgi:DNA-binding SARP family transcriptional activator